jgi:hypothetical protein
MTQSRGPVTVRTGVGELAPGAPGTGSTAAAPVPGPLGVANGVGADPLLVDGSVGCDPEQAAARSDRPMSTRFTPVTP